MMQTRWLPYGQVFPSQSNVMVKAVLGFLFGMGFSILFLLGMVWREAVKIYERES